MLRMVDFWHNFETNDLRKQAFAVQGWTKVENTINTLLSETISGDYASCLPQYYIQTNFHIEISSPHFKDMHNIPAPTPSMEKQRKIICDNVILVVWAPGGYFLNELKAMSKICAESELARLVMLQTLQFHYHQTNQFNTCMYEYVVIQQISLV